MQSRAITGAIAVALVAVAVVLFVVLRDSDDDETAATTTTTATTETKAGSQAQPEQQEPQRPEFTTIVVKGGEPVGGVKALDYEHGDRVRLQVRSDVADEVHVHGYDLTKDVAPGKDVKFNFVADIDGGFEVELEGAHTELAELTVKPA